MQEIFTFCVDLVEGLWAYKTRSEFVENRRRRGDGSFEASGGVVCNDWNFYPILDSYPLPLVLQNQPQLTIETDLRFERIKHLLPQQFGDERLLGVNRRWRFYRYYSGNLPLGLKIAGGSQAEQDFSGIGEEPFAWEFDARSTSIWTAAKVSEAFRWCLAGEWYCPRRWPGEVHLWCPWWWDTFQAHLHHLFDTWNLTLPAHPETFPFPQPSAAIWSSSAYFFEVS